MTNYKFNQTRRRVKRAIAYTKKFTNVCNQKWPKVKGPKKNLNKKK